MSPDTFTTLVQALQITVATSLIFLSGTHILQNRPLSSLQIDPYHWPHPAQGSLPRQRRLGLSHFRTLGLSQSSLLTHPGLSSCLSLWLIPLTTRLPPAQACTQFTQTVTWGFQYLQPSSRILGALLLATTILTASLPDAEDAEKWKSWAVALAVLVPVAAYEVYCIFPINDRVKEIGESIVGAGGKGVERELEGLFGKWKGRNWGRVGMPLVAGVVGWMGVVRR